MHNPKLKHRLHTIDWPNAAHPWRAGWTGVQGIRRGLCGPDPRCEVCHHRRRRPFATDRTGRSLHRRDRTLYGCLTRIIEKATMKIWHFSETAYPYLPDPSGYDSVRIDLPNRYYDPEKGAALFDRFITEWQVAEEEGFEIMLNEHHQTPTCVDPAGPLLLAALARVTTTARLLILGNPVANRRQPVRVAEEMAFADILSHGRIEVGFVRGVPYELSPANSNPVYTTERQWEAIDLIHQGVHQSRRAIQPRRPLLPRKARQHLAAPVPDAASADLGRVPQAPTAQRASARAAISRQRSSPATTRPSRCSKAIAAAGARPGAATTCRSTASPTRRSPTAPTTRSAPARGAEQLLWHISINKIPTHYQNPPGYNTIESVAKGMRVGLGRYPKAPTVDAAVESGIMFAGTPDQVLQAVREVLRPRGRLRPSPGRRPVGLPEPRGHGARHPHAGARSVPRT